MKTLFVSLEDFNKGVCLSTPVTEDNGRTLSSTILSSSNFYTLTTTWSWDGYNQVEAEKRMLAVAFLYTYSNQPITMEKILTILNG